MRGNTPPRVPDIESDDEIEFVDDLLPDLDVDFVEDEDDEMEEVSLEELEAGLMHSNGEQDDAKLTFNGHGSAVFSCSLHPNGELAATGGEDEVAFVWNTQTGGIVHEIRAHKDTITEVHFNHDGTMLATADMAGEILVFKLSTDQGTNCLNFEQVWAFSMGDMAWMRWHRATNVLLAGSEDGEIYMWRIPSAECKILVGPGSRCEVGDLSDDGKKFIAGYTNGHVKVWDLKTCTVLVDISEGPMAHHTCVTTVAADPNSGIYMSGDEDGKIVFITNNGPVAAAQAHGGVEYIVFSPSIELKMAASGTLSGQIAIWDPAKHSTRTLCNHSESDGCITRLKWINDYKLLAATVTGDIFGYDARSGARIFSLSGHVAEIYEVKFNPQSKMLLSVSEDNTAKIFELPITD